MAGRPPSHRMGLVLCAMLSGLVPASPGRAAVGVAQTATSNEAADLRDWAIASGDADGLPFIIIDKSNAQAMAFDGQGIFRGSTPVLLGAAKGDVSPPGIGTMPLAQIGPTLRITPSGRFDASIGRDLGPHEVLWVDYDAAISLHRVVTSNPAEHRLSRLASITPDDNRISYGCINVPVAFFDRVVLPLFRQANGIVYVMPERPADTDLYR